jgi:hypothetical protein
MKYHGSWLIHSYLISASPFELILKLESIVVSYDKITISGHQTST